MIFEGVDDIPWGELTYAYWGRCDVPALLRSLLIDDEAFVAAAELLNELHHQGGFVWAWARPGLLALLGDQDPAVRTGVIWTLCKDTVDPDEVARALVAGWPDPDASVRTDTLLALGSLAERLSAAVLPEILVFLRDQANGADAHHAMYATLALAKAPPGRPLPVASAGARALAGVDGLPGGHLAIMRDVLADDRRHSYWGGITAISEDLELRALLTKRLSRA